MTIALIIFDSIHELGSERDYVKTNSTKWKEKLVDIRFANLSAWYRYLHFITDIEIQYYIELPRINTIDEKQKKRKSDLVEHTKSDIWCCQSM